jgi:hypothetical protein
MAAKSSIAAAIARFDVRSGARIRNSVRAGLDSHNVTPPISARPLPAASYFRLAFGVPQA